KASNTRGWAAVFGGAGGGYAPAAGGFSALDVGGVVSYPNCIVEPFANVMAFASVPVGARQGDFRDSHRALVAPGKASTTVALGFGAGIEVPLAHDRCRRGLTPPHLQLGVGLNALYPSEGIITTTTMTDGTTTTTQRGGSYAAVGAAVGLEWPF